MASLTMLLAILARNGGLALVVGVLWIPLEQAIASVMAVFAMLPAATGLRFFTAEGALGQLMRWTLSYNSANWTYLADATRAPMPMNLQNKNDLTRDLDDGVGYGFGDGLQAPEVDDLPAGKFI